MGAHFAPQSIVVVIVVVDAGEGAPYPGQGIPIGTHVLGPGPKVPSGRSKYPGHSTSVGRQFSGQCCPCGTHVSGPIVPFRCIGPGQVIWSDGQYTGQCCPFVYIPFGTHISISGPPSGCSGPAHFTWSGGQCMGQCCPFGTHISGPIFPSGC